VIPGARMKVHYWDYTGISSDLPCKKDYLYVMDHIFVSNITISWFAVHGLKVSEYF